MYFVSCCIYAACIGLAGFVLGRVMLKRLFRPGQFPYRAYTFEQEGRIYRKIGIHRWQAIVPDMSRILPKFMMRKRIFHRPNDAQLTAMIRETCVAEMIHMLLGIAGVYMIWLWPGPGGVIAFAVYALLGNLPFILIQRYNRPRLMALLHAYRRQAQVKKRKRTIGEKKVLILSCNTGEGHNSCAKAIQEAFQARNMHCDIEDALQYVSPRFSRLMSKGHVYIYRHHPRLFRFGYRFSEKHPGLFREHSLIHWLLTLGADPLASHIVDDGYDIVITTHVFSSMMLTELQHRHGLDIRTSFVATDYTSSPSMDASDLELYFIPDASLARDFKVGSITQERIIDSGIPVRQSMYVRMDKAEAKRACGIPENARHLLVMCGSMGCGPLKWVIALLKKEMLENQYITVVCGTNEKLYRQLTRRYGDNERIRIYGYRQDIPLLMDSADLYLTKPGGLSVTEAAVKNLPMVMINAVAGCEEYNKNFFVKNGLGVTGDSIWSLSRLCMDILGDDESLAQMRRAGMRKQWKNAPQFICEAILERC